MYERVIPHNIGIIKVISTPKVILFNIKKDTQLYQNYLKF